MRPQYGLGFQSVSSGSNYEQHLHGFYAKNEFIKIGVNHIFYGIYYVVCLQLIFWNFVDWRDKIQQYSSTLDTNWINYLTWKHITCLQKDSSIWNVQSVSHRFISNGKHSFVSLFPRTKFQTILRKIECTLDCWSDRTFIPKPHSFEKSKDQNVPKIGGYFSSIDRNTEWHFPKWIAKRQ